MSNQVCIKFKATSMGCPDGFTQNTYFEGYSYNLDAEFAQGFIDQGVAVFDEDYDQSVDRNQNGTVELGEMSVKDLKAIAADEKIDLGDAKLKAEIVSAIEAARKAKADNA